jgi:hypothetical protein
MHRFGVFFSHTCSPSIPRRMQRGTVGEISAWKIEYSPATMHPVDRPCDSDLDAFNPLHLPCSLILPLSSGSRA